MDSDAPWMDPDTVITDAASPPPLDEPDRVRVTGKHLRYLLLVVLADARRTLTIPEMAEAIRRRGFVVPRSAAKAISDSLRAELDKGRVVKARRGQYRAGPMSRQVIWRMRKRVEAHRAASAG